MKRVLVAALLLAACRGDRGGRGTPDEGQPPKAIRDAGRDGPASAVSAVPKLPLSNDGVAELRAIDKRIQIHRAEPATLIGLLLERAALRGQLEDYQRALEVSAALVASSPRDQAAWQLRVQALTRVHDFPAARRALDELVKLAPGLGDEPALALALATGDSERASAGYEALAQAVPSPLHVTMWAASLAALGRLDDALALVPKAAALVRDNPPQLAAWLLFQWGRLYEQKGELATARDYYAAAHARMPGHLEATAHLAQAMKATGDGAGARALVDAALVDNRHPALLALAAELGRHELAPEAAREWERYVAALPLAFSDHVARFYLGEGHDARRALDLARVNLENRDTDEARALFVEAALAANDAPAACGATTSLVKSGVRAHRFLAWQALTRCGRRAEADRLAGELGIAH